jgi:hypothetical protein
MALFDSTRPRPTELPPSPAQPEPLPVEEQARVLAWSLSRELHMPVRLAITDNRTTMISFQRGPTGLRLRLHHMFLAAPNAIKEALVEYLARGSQRAGAQLDDYIRQHPQHIRMARTEESPELNAVGRCINLQSIFDDMNREHFDGAIRAEIGWGRTPGRRRRKSIRLGVYDHQLREIRIHPALDSPTVPRFFVEFIVFHEMLHQVFPSTAGTPQRRVHHPRAFREREKTFPRYQEALEWERGNLGQLLRR